MQANLAVLNAPPYFMCAQLYFMSLYVASAQQSCSASRIVAAGCKGCGFRSVPGNIYPFDATYQLSRDMLLFSRQVGHRVLVPERPHHSLRSLITPWPGLHSLKGRQAYRKLHANYISITSKATVRCPASVHILGPSLGHACSPALAVALAMDGT
jgi:hypothetical protein